jgi:hypothetical protein
MLLLNKSKRVICKQKNMPYRFKETEIWSIQCPCRDPEKRIGINYTSVKMCNVHFKN